MFEPHLEAIRFCVSLYHGAVKHAKKISQWTLIYNYNLYWIIKFQKCVSWYKWDNHKYPTGQGKKGKT